MNTQDIDLSKLDGVTFKHGSHANPQQGMCVMEAVSWLVNDGSFTDFPACVPREIARLAQRINDLPWDSDVVRTEALRPFIPRMLRASHSRESRTKRGYIAAHYAAQRAADALESAKIEGDHVAKLRVASVPTSREECLALRAIAQDARRAAYAAADAADAAYAAAAAADAAAYAAADAADAAYAAYAKRLEARRGALLGLLGAFCDVEDGAA